MKECAMGEVVKIPKFSLVLENHVSLYYDVRVPFLNISRTSLEF